MLTNGMFTSESDTWGTPLGFYLKLDKEFNFQIDLCADKTNYKHEVYYTIEDDSLSQSWDDIIGYCNPPYGSKIDEWVKKGATAKNSIIVMLIPARTDTNYWHDYVIHAKEIRFIKGRLKFEDKYRLPYKSSPFPSAVVIFDGGEHQPLIGSMTP
jgi:site-specific DNA-methyltransferase (adenine-specific)